MTKRRLSVRQLGVVWVVGIMIVLGGGYGWDSGVRGAETAPASMPAEAATQAGGYRTPQEFLRNATTDQVAAMTVEQAMALCAFDPESAKDKATAKLMAVNAIAEAKLEKAVEAKWGKEAEATLAHAIGDFTPADAAKAMWEIKEDHASATFAVDGLMPMLLVKKDGFWKLDMVGYRATMGENMDKLVVEATVAMDRLTQEVAKKGAGDAEEFTRHAAAEMEKVGADSENDKKDANK